MGAASAVRFLDAKLLIDMVQVEFDVPAARSSRRAISLSRNGLFGVSRSRTVSGLAALPSAPRIKAVPATQSARLLACVRVQNIFGS
jgi:hypothetical protein